ncbi:replication initiator protein A [Deinococcus cellulosilyticus]|uniref:Plasmid replication initiator protein n=1 Tax=Deinococcus cellulosilyticus (strain DSM 18568 / NBRC 106333 / KACC 11606 / 5516J-15) TaxID=1223518 RepID=A0A511MVK8_DEIC1|nr:replication initiator protein A [Deinococcus cellulosilyticus]GEM44619.1 hypothetical protein DC3_02540 [Deinococcus cellulosilyticus NBRC 106333 = KACC 11606]
MAKKEPINLRRFDELNLARLGLISVQRTIPENLTRWEVEHETDGRVVRVVCAGTTEYGGVPHGIDNDISAAIINLFIESGSPEDGALTFTTYQLLRAAGLSTSVRYYNLARESLLRLYSSSYLITEGWRDHPKRRWVTVGFRYVEKIEFTSADGDTLDGRSIIRVVLPKELVHSIRAGYIKPLDLQFMRSLEQPTTRALFRLLDAQRVDPEDPSRTVQVLQVDLLEWAEMCKLVLPTAHRIRRALEPAHEELIAKGYLASVSYSGRGKKQHITYAFAQGVLSYPISQEFVDLLIENGVAESRARDLVRQYGEQVREASTRMENMLKSGFRPRNRAGFLVDLLTNPGKYALDAENQAALDQETPRLELDRQVATAEQTEQQRLRQEYSQMTPEQRGEHVVRTLNLLIRSALKPLEYDLLQDAVVQGEVDGFQLIREASTAVIQKKLNVFVDAIRKLLY